MTATAQVTVEGFCYEDHWEFTCRQILQMLSELLSNTGGHNGVEEWGAYTCCHTCRKAIHPGTQAWESQQLRSSEGACVSQMLHFCSMYSATSDYLLTTKGVLAKDSQKCTDLHQSAVPQSPTVWLPFMLFCHIQ